MLAAQPPMNGRIVRGSSPPRQISPPRQVMIRQAVSPPRQPVAISMAAAKLFSLPTQESTYLPSPRQMSPRLIGQQPDNKEWHKVTQREERETREREARESYNDGTTGLKGCPLTLPKYSKRLILAKGQDHPALEDGSSKAMESPRPASPRTQGRSVSPNSQITRSGRSLTSASSTTLLRNSKRAVDRCHADLYEDASARQQRLKDMKGHLEKGEDAEQAKRLEKWDKEMRDRQRWYHVKAHKDKAPTHTASTHLEREEEIIRRRAAHADRRELAKKEREDEEMKECTFKPILFNKSRSGVGNRQQSPRGRRDDNDLPPALRLRHIVERQRNAHAQLQALSTEESGLRDHLRTVHADLHDRVQREETQRVVTMLQDTDADGNTQRDLIQRVRRMVAAGHDPETAQKQIVEELVARSQDEVRRRVLEAFGPLRLEQEGDLYTRRLAVVHELEAVEAHVIALRGGTMLEEAKDMGFEFGLAERGRRSLPPVPGPSSTAYAKQPGTPRASSETGEIQAHTGGLNQGRLHSTGSSAQPMTPGGTAIPQNGATGLTPRSAASQSPSRQSSGQPSLSGSILQPVKIEGETPPYSPRDHANSLRSASAVSLTSGTGAEAAAAVDAARQAQLAAGAFFAARSRMGASGSTGAMLPVVHSSGLSPASSIPNLISKPTSEGIPTPAGGSVQVGMAIAQSAVDMQLAVASSKDVSQAGTPMVAPAGVSVASSMGQPGTPRVTQAAPQHVQLPAAALQQPMSPRSTGLASPANQSTTIVSPRIMPMPRPAAVIPMPVSGNPALGYHRGAATSSFSAMHGGMQVIAQPNIMMSPRHMGVASAPVVSMRR